MEPKKLNFSQFDFTTVEEGLENLKKAVNLRNSMGGALYYNILNDDCITLALRLINMGEDKDKIWPMIKAFGV